MKKQKTDYKKIALDGILYNNPVFVQLLGMCSTLAITTTVFNGIGMGLCVTFVLMFSNLFFGQTGREVFMWQLEGLNPLRILKK